MSKSSGHTPGKTDEQLMTLLSKGDKLSFETLYDRYFDKLVWFARSFVNDTQIAEDIVQEVFIKLIEKPELFNQENRFSTWIYTLTANRSKNLLRDETNRDSLLQALPARGPSRMIIRHDHDLIQNTIRKVVNDLNDKQRTLFVLRFEQQLPLKEIAGITGIPEGSVKSGIFYLLKKLSEQLKPFTHEN